MSKSTGNSPFRLWSGILFLFVCTTASLYAQGKPLAEKLVSLNVKNETLKSIFDKITQQTSLYFTGSADQLDRNFRTSITVTNEPLNSVLSKLLKGKGVSWLIGEKTITIVKGGESSSFKTVASDYPSDTINTVNLSGRVKDEKGLPIVGATVLVRGSKIGTTTNSGGDFSIKNIKASGTIVISGIGFITQEILFKNQSNIGQIILKEYIGNLDETVVIAYGTTTRRFSIGNISTVNAKEIEKQPVNNVLLALQGRVPGMSINQYSGLPGSTVSIQIRGQNSLNRINGNILQTQPLIIIDGLPYNNTIPGLGGGGFGLGQLSALAFINPTDIESIDVLKDADATAIYGSRGANGVILITTKKGKIGQSNVNINVSTGFGEITKNLNLLKTADYIEMRKEAYINDGLLIPTKPSISNLDLTVYDQTRYTDWQKELIGGTAHYTNCQSSISGGTEILQYLIGGTYYKETTVFPGSQSDKKASTHFSITSLAPNKKFVATLTGSYMVDNTNLKDYNFSNNIFIAPNAPAPYESNGNLNWAPVPLLGYANYPSWNNPYSALLRPYNSKIKNLTSSANLSYHIFNNLMINTTVGYSDIEGNSFTASPLSAIAPAFLSNYTGSAVYNKNSIQNISVEPQINYKPKFKNVSLDFLIGSSFQTNKTESEQINALGYTSDDLLKNLGSAGSYFASNSSEEYKYNAVFGRLIMNYRDKYILSLNARRDGSSRFGPGNQFGNFGSMGAAWLFANENFLKSKMEFLSFGKLRISYGNSGNENIGNYQYLELYENTTVGQPYQGVRGLTSSGLYNPYYSWEKTNKFEVGLDLGFLNDRLLLNTSFYQNRSSNQLVNAPLPATSGPGSLIINSPAAIRNRGFEVIIITTNIKSRNITWSTNINFSLNKDKLLAFPNLQNSIYAQDYTIGKSFTDIRVFKFAGVDPATGKFQFSDKDKTPTFTPDRLTDRTEFINVSPKYFGGFLNSITYKSLSLDIFFQYVKQTGRSFNHRSIVGHFSAGNQPLKVLDRWEKDGDITDVEKYSRNISFQSSYDYLDGSDKAYTDASFIRLKNLSLSYSFANIMKHKFKEIRLYLQAQNLITITNFRGGDPETSFDSNNYSLPPLRIVTVGLKLGI